MYSDEILMFMESMRKQIFYGCALPVNIDDDTIVEVIMNCARYFWENYDEAVYESQFVIPIKFFHPTLHNGQKAKSVCLPSCVRAIFNCQRTKCNNLLAPIKDVDIRQGMISATIGGGYGAIGGTPINGIGEGRRNLQDFVVAIYEYDTYRMVFGETLTFDWNYAMSKLIILGDDKGDNIACQGYLNVPVESLIRLQIFRDYVLAKLRKAVATSYSVFEFTLPGGVSISFDKMEGLADEDISKIEEKINNHNHTFIFMPNQI